MSANDTEQAGRRTNGDVNGTADPSTLPPGAERFWGEFSKARAGRTNRRSDGGDGHGSRGSGQECLEWCPVCRSADLIRTAAPPDVRNQVEAIQNEAFNVMRAFFTAYADKTSDVWQAAPGRSRDDRPDPPGETGTDIPID